MTAFLVIALTVAVVNLLQHDWLGAAVFGFQAAGFGVMERQRRHHASST